MILEEFLNDETLVKHYSDNNVLLMQVETQIMYPEPIDIVPCPYTYEETDIPIEEKDEDENSSKEENPEEE